MATHLAKEWHQQVVAAIEKNYPDKREHRRIAHIILNYHLSNYSQVAYIINKPIDATEEACRNLGRSIQRLKNYEPVQYILGEVTFLDTVLAVTPDVLIPRPETEELVSEVINHYREHKAFPKTIADLGTGSGCMAIALAKKFPEAKVTAIDLSAKALCIAEKNAVRNGCHNINFLQKDLYVLDKLLSESFDLIISNPPYIPMKEKKKMPLHITKHEPSSALFVPSEDPSVFYQKIGQIAYSHLSGKGLLTVEVHSDMADEVAAIFQDRGIKKVEIKKDLQGKKRFLWGSLH